MDSLDRLKEAIVRAKIRQGEAALLGRGYAEPLQFEIHIDTIFDMAPSARLIFGEKSFDGTVDGVIEKAIELLDGL